MRRTDRPTNPSTPTAPTAEPVIGVAADITLHAARGWWIAAWIVLLATVLGGAWYGRLGKPAGYLTAGVALGLLLLISQPALST